MPPGMGEE